MILLFLSIRIVASAFLVALASVTTSSIVQGQRSASSDGTVFPLLADGRVFALDMRGGAVIA
jgi:hypothetical protein